MSQTAQARPAARGASSRSFRIGKVKAYHRGKVWYLCYHENGRRRRPRVGPDRDAARRLAAQINGQLESGACAALSFEPISIPDLRQSWLDHHEHVLRSSVQTINRYRTASEHLVSFLEQHRARLASLFSARDAEAFVRYLRNIEVPPNGHKNSAKRKLLDKGVKFILETCRALFAYAAKRRHLSPYAENPFTAIEIGRIPVENAKPILLFTPQQEKQFLEACDDWQFPLFLTLMLTGLRPGELVHLLLPDDLDLDAGVLRVRNKAALGWQVKTRSEREIPLIDELVQILRVCIGARTVGPVFLRRGRSRGTGMALAEAETELTARVTAREQAMGRPLSRAERLATAKSLWWSMGAVREDRVRVEFMRLTSKVGPAGLTMPKVLRHLFATSLQDANVDPLIRNQLMGHAPAGEARPGAGLGMTAVYTHSRPQTVRAQLVSALARRVAVEVAREWLRQRPGDAGAGAGLHHRAGCGDALSIVRRTFRR